jgi:hypothetical protein
VYNGSKIIAGLLIFLVLLSFPFWYNNGISGKANPKPETKIVTAEKECVAPKAFMRDAHMTFLSGWRDDVVRREQRLFVSANGQTHDKSLTGTCLNCHPNKSEFCDCCHTFMAVSPYCFDCHVEPKEPDAEMGQLKEGL